MKAFKNLTIFGDTLAVICVDTDTNEEVVAFEIDLKLFYFNSNQDLEHNVFSTDSSWLFDDEDDEDDEEEESEEISEGTPVNREFMENFCCDVPNVVAMALEGYGIIVDVVGYEDEENEHERLCYYVGDYFEAEIKQTLNIDDNWQKKAPCRYSDEDAAILREAGIDPCGDVPDEVLALIKKGVPVLKEMPKFLQDEEELS